MKLEILQNGQLCISLEGGADNEAISDLLACHGGDDRGLAAELLEDTGWSPNGRLYLVAPEDIGALTDSPIFADRMDHDDTGRVREVGNVWWFPNYQVENFAEKLLAEGSVCFVAAPENEPGAAMTL